MSHDVQIIDPCDSREWLEFVHEHPDADIFHHPAWLTMLRDVYGYTMFAACMMEGKRIRAGIPFAHVRSLLTGNRWVSVPFSDHCKPLLPENGADAGDALIAFLKQKQSIEIPKIEMRWLAPSAERVFSHSDFVYHVLQLGADEDTLFRSFDKKGTQWSVRQSEKLGVVVKECSTYEEFEQFYHLMVMTRKRLGVPAQSRSFFKAIWEYLIKPGLGFVLVSYRGSTPVAGGVFFKFKQTISYKYSASDREFRLLQPNHAFLWSAIRRANNEGYRTFDFGRSEKDNEGLRRFKRGWSAQEHDLYYSVIADKAPENGHGTVGALAGFVIRNSPAFVCRLSGELLYKHFA